MSDCPENGARFLSLTKAAQRLGVSKSGLRRLQELSDLYRPAVKGMPGATDEVGCSYSLYHVRQLELLEAAMLGAVDLETASTAWEIHRRRLRQRVGRVATRSGEKVAEFTEL